jgi:hypothetical protein
VFKISHIVQFDVQPIKLFLILNDDGVEVPSDNMKAIHGSQTVEGLLAHDVR